jgi:hypothetical protein
VFVWLEYRRRSQQNFVAIVVIVIGVFFLQIIESSQKGRIGFFQGQILETALQNIMGNTNALVAHQTGRGALGTGKAAVVIETAVAVAVETRQRRVGTARIYDWSNSSSNIRQTFFPIFKKIRGPRIALLKGSRVARVGRVAGVVAVHGVCFVLFCFVGLVGWLVR